MTDTLVVDRIESNLTRLRLPKIKEILEGVLNASEKKDASYLNFLDELLGVSMNLILRSNPTWIDKR
jgi:hypothetical protein